MRITQGRFDEAIGLFQEGIAREQARAPCSTAGWPAPSSGRAGTRRLPPQYREYARLAPGAADAQELAARAAALERRAAPTS